jgi:hypothetical protein
MPVNRRYPLKELMAACRAYIEETNRQVTFEYVLIKGVNDSAEDAKKLAGLITAGDRHVCPLLKVNLIPFNAPHPNPLPGGEREYARHFPGGEREYTRHFPGEERGYTRHSPREERGYTRHFPGGERGYMRHSPRGEEGYTRHSPRGEREYTRHFPRGERGL